MDPINLCTADAALKNYCQAIDKFRAFSGPEIEQNCLRQLVDIARWQHKKLEAEDELKAATERHTEALRRFVAEKTPVQPITPIIPQAGRAGLAEEPLPVNTSPLTEAEQDEIISLLVETRHHMGNGTEAIREWMAENKRAIDMTEIFNLHQLARVEWATIQAGAKVFANKIRAAI